MIIAGATVVVVIDVDVVVVGNIETLRDKGLIGTLVKRGDKDTTTTTTTTTTATTMDVVATTATMEGGTTTTREVVHPFITNVQMFHCGIQYL